MEYANLHKSTAEEILEGIEIEIHKGSVASPPLNGLTAALQMKVIEGLCDSIDEFRKSNDEASKAMKRWTMVLAGATIVLAIATIILALK